MDQLQSSKITQKAIVTRQRILDTALGLFATKGYEKTTMREIAAEAECSLGLTYRYFASKEKLVLELYLKLENQLEEQASQLAPGSIADRFQRIILAQFELMTPHRETLGAIFGPALNPRATAGVFGESTAGVRRQARDIYIKIVTGSRDAPRGAQIEEIATILYGMQLALTLFWLQDLSPGTQKTYEFVAFLRDMLALMRPLLRLPVVSKALARLAMIVGPMLGDPKEA
ncbi:MAG TPA: TetR/AcrR family transcriptional regulator [Ktedonobacteraceae bacterium]